MAPLSQELEPPANPGRFTALVVLIYHIDFMISPSREIFSRGYLCVDFFFILSGYVISASYDHKISRGLGRWEFTVIRIARLWPLVVLTTLLAVIVQVARLRRDTPDLDYISIAITLGFNMAMLPSPRSPSEVLFPFNGAAWSIFFEFVANLLYILFFGKLSGRLLGAIILASGVALAGTAIAFNTLDVGMTESTFLFGLPRVLFSFFLGIYLFRQRDAFKFAEVGPLPLLLGLLLVGGLMSAPKMSAAPADGMVDLLITIVVFPLLLRLAIATREGYRLASVSWFLGGISYSVYLLQTPLMVGFSGLPQLFWGQKIAAFAPWAGVLFTLLLIPTAYVCWTHFERPAQRWLRGLLLRDAAISGEAVAVAAGQASATASEKEGSRPS